MKDNKTLIEGVNLSKDEYKKCAEVNRELASCEFKEIEDKFISAMRQKFGAFVFFDSLKPKDNSSPISILACRFKRERPLLFLITNRANDSWTVVDEKRLTRYGDDSFQFEKANV